MEGQTEGDRDGGSKSHGGLVPAGMGPSETVAFLQGILIASQFAPDDELSRVMNAAIMNCVNKQPCGCSGKKNG